MSKSHSKNTINKILIANRGEIACRIAYTARDMGIKTVAVASDIDRDALHRQVVDEIVHIGGATPAESYLDSKKILDAADKTHADAIHPGYGFLSENANFAKACENKGIVFIGPSPDVIEQMGLKDTAREIMDKAGVPIVPEAKGKDLKAAASKIGFPVLVKAAAGGGGKGMRKVDNANDLKDAMEACQREAKSAFGNDSVFVEKYIEHPRHIEVQIFGDSHGNVVHLFERDCSLQRRHQKVVEEAPAPNLPEALRVRIHEAAVTAAKTLGYTNAGTVEFILDASGKLTENTPFYFMEMNTRLQVEHPVTEMITGHDLVEWQIRIARGEKLPHLQNKITHKGHAFEVRLYAEDPARDFAPQTGRLKDVILAGRNEYRLDTGFQKGDEISSYYDPMLAKLCTFGETRDDAADKMRRALGNIQIVGLQTNQEYLRKIFDHKAFLAGDVHTHFIENHHDELIKPIDMTPSVLAMAVYPLLHDVHNNGYARRFAVGANWRLNAAYRSTFILMHQGAPITFDVTGQGERYRLSYETKSALVDYIDGGDGTLLLDIDGTVHKCLLSRDRGDIIVNVDGQPVRFHVPGLSNDDALSAGDNVITAPMPGRITDILVKNGQNVKAGDPVIRMEAMKIETTLSAGQIGKITDLKVAKDDIVADGAVLARIEESD